MPQMPFVTTLENDELLYSYLMRLAKFNGFDNISLFYKTYILNDLDTRVDKVPYDIHEDLYKFHKALCLENDSFALEFYLKTSIFPGIAPFLSKSTLSNYIGSLSPYKKTTKLFNTPHHIITKLHYCPLCMKEEHDKLAYFYYHRAHHMPGVTVCYKHNVNLNIYTGKASEEFSMPLQYEELISYKKSYEYAIFCKDFLNANIQINAPSLVQIIHKKYKELGYADSKQLDLDMEEYLDLVELKPSKFINRNYASTNYLNMTTCLVLLLFLFKDIKALQSYINTQIDHALEQDFFNMINNKYDIISTYNENLVILKCQTCETPFLSTPFRITSGWGCPCCDNKLDDKALFNRLFDIESSGEYTLLSEFNGLESEVEVRHNLCNKTYKIKVNEFLNEHRKCNCSNKINYDIVAKKIASTEGFKLQHFTSVNEPISVYHKNCNTVFSTYYNQFIKHFNCPYCDNIGMTKWGFSNEIHDLVGDNYTLAGEYVDINTEIAIRHNYCGNTEKYKPRQFLNGLRCSKCSPKIHKNSFKKLVSDISKELYICEEYESKNCVHIKNTETNETLIMTTDKVLQELLRPTPSPILPTDKRDLSITTTSIKKDVVSDYIHIFYNKKELIFLEDITIKDISYVTLKKSMETLIKNNEFKSIDMGIYAYPDAIFTPEEIVKAKYIKRKNNAIGYLAGKSLAYELGLRKEKPSRIEIVTNKESQTHGRSRTYKGISLKIHGPRIEINNNNHIILATLTFIMSYKQRKYVDTGDVFSTLYNWLISNNIKLIDFEPYYQYYASWSKSLVETIYREGGKICEE